MDFVFTILFCQGEHVVFLVFSSKIRTSLWQFRFVFTIL
nr:MAG TPA: hypothetical protein [Caudoviricetes sp.]